MLHRDPSLRAVHPLSRSRRGSSHQLCDQCEEYGSFRDYCNVCEHVFCNKCWQRQLPHKKQTLALGSIPHERTDERAARKIRDALEGKTDSTEQEDMHKDDEDTTWFGITWEHAEFPVFRDYGRFASIMADSHGRFSDHNLEWAVGVQDHRYPR